MATETAERWICLYVRSGRHEATRVGSREAVEKEAGELRKDPKVTVVHTERVSEEWE